MEVTPELATAKARVPNQSSVPDGWRHVRLTEVARLESGHTPSKRQPDYWGGTIPWVSLHDTEGLDAWEIQTTSQRITEAGLSNSSARLLPKGTVVFSRTATVGKSTVMGRAMATSQDFACYVCGPEVHNFYLALLLRSMRTEWKKLMAGSIHNTVYMPVFKTLSVDLPPHDEQVAIANAMRDVERMIDSLEQLLTKKRQIKQGAMQEMLIGQRRLPGFDQPWISRRFAEVASVSRERVNPSALSKPPLCIELEHLQPGTGRLSGDAFKSQQAATKSVFRQGDVLFGKLRAYLRKYWLAEFDGVCSTEIWVMRPRGELASSAYLFYTVQRDDFIEAASTAYGTHMPRSDWKVVSEFDLSLPRDWREQAAIATTLSDMDAEITALESRLSKARALKQAMAQALLTGRIRIPLPPQEPAA